MNTTASHPPGETPPSGPASDWDLRLYIAGGRPRSIAAVANLKRLCEVHLAGRYRMEVIDLLKDPKRARDDQVVAIPTVIRRSPLPVIKVAGDLADINRALAALEVRPTITEEERSS